MPDMIKRAQEVADDLRGTARDLSEFATDKEISNLKFCAALDDIIFNCNLCGWWCDVDEMMRDEICKECFDADHDHDCDDDE